MQVHEPETLYNICLNSIVENCVTKCKFCEKEFRVLPNNVLLDFYYLLYSDKRLCFLATELSSLDVFSRMLLVPHQRTRLLRMFQSLLEHVCEIPGQLVNQFRVTADAALDPDRLRQCTELGLRLGGFLNEGAWYQYSIEVLEITVEVCERRKEDRERWGKLLECYHMKLFAESAYCMLEQAEKTFKKSEEAVNKLKELNALPNLSGLYSHYSIYYLVKSDYDQAYNWSMKALRLLSEDLPARNIIEVLREASKSCVMKRHFHQAGLLIGQAVCLGGHLYSRDRHPHYADTLLDYGFYLLYSDSIQESVRVYERSLQIRKEVFEKNNVLVALGMDDLAYALYVHEYVTGRFYHARENVERAIKIMERILPKDHLLLSSAKRVKALILEEIALEMRDAQSSSMQEKYLNDAEQLHKCALTLSLKAFGEKNVQTAKHYGNLGRLYQSMKQYELAEKMHLKAIAIKEELLGKYDYEVALSCGHLASLYNYHMKRYKDAEVLYLRSIEINLNLFGETYSGLQYDYRGIINVYKNLDDVQSVLEYNSKMRDWKKLRDKMVSKSPKYEILPLKVLIEKFFAMTVAAE